MSQKIVFKKRQPKEKKAEEELTDEAVGGYDVDQGKPAEEKKAVKKSKKSSRPTLSFDEDEEDE